ncbi:winged helix-turn-helix transcriptional regulator [Faecalispora anaeroviscerum]|uniref:winged helix-turn-helix transcriptional regulator n=1 Tax=Faecalispora anaeroviscerum TaxID=2991836 RepID=UPI0024B8D386|nr:helix-turn-helix domain-containing protein [Faecalispora anaeroviscerum]
MKKEKEKKKKRARAAEEPELPDLPQTPESGGTKDSLSLLHQKLGGKWKPRILWVLRGGESLRYREIKAGIAGITDMMLSQSLRELSADGLVERRQFQEIPPRVEYQITPAGAGALPGLELLAKWMTNNFE